MKFITLKGRFYENPTISRALGQIPECFLWIMGVSAFHWGGCIYLPWGSTNMVRKMKVSTIFRSTFRYLAGTGAKPVGVKCRMIFAVTDEMSNAHNT